VSIIGVKSLPIQEFAASRMTGSLNSWIVPMIDSSTASSAAPRTSGTLMRVAIWNPVAPSRRAAS